MKDFCLFLKLYLKNLMHDGKNLCEKAEKKGDEAVTFSEDIQENLKIGVPINTIVKKFEEKTPFSEKLHTLYYSLQNKLQLGSLESVMLEQSFEGFLLRTAQNIHLLNSAKGQLSEKKKKHHK